MCRSFMLYVYVLSCYIQPLNKKLLDLSSPACMYPPMAASDQELKKVLLQSYAEFAVRDVMKII
jgi:hypothetical protein